MNNQSAGSEHIGNRLRMVRRERGLTQAQLGELSGTNQAVIQKIENGNSMRPRQIMQIAQILEVNPAWLQFGDLWARRDLPSHRKC